MQDEELPSRFGRYEVLARVAAGGMAEVFAGRIVGESGFAKLVAIKVMREELLDEERFVAMFLDEARVAAQVSHPNVVAMLDLGRSERGVPYLVMELVVGASVSQLLKGDEGSAPLAMPVAHAVEIAAQAADGLHAAHEARDALGTPLEIVHRDVSPQNILVGLDGRARITDFGVARAVARLTRTEVGEVKGKARYFSPEQALGRDLDRRSDLFSLGIVLWEVLALRPLFTGRAMGDVIRAVATQPIPSVRETRPEVPEEVAAAIGRLLERDPDARVSTGAEASRLLRAAADAGGVPAPRAGAVAVHVRARAERSITALTDEIRKKTAAPLEFADATETSSTGGFSDDEPTAVDREFVARMQAQRRPPAAAHGDDVATDTAHTPPRAARDVEPPTRPAVMAPPATYPSAAASSPSFGAETLRDEAPSHATEPALASPPVSPPGARFGHPTLIDGTAAPSPDRGAPAPRPKLTSTPTLPLGAMSPFDPVPVVRDGATQGVAVQAPTTTCPRCARVVAADALSYAQDGSRICKPCEAQELSDAADGLAVNSVAGMGYASLLSSLLGLCSWLYFVPSALAIAGAVAFFLHVARHPQTRRRMGWQLPAAGVCAILGLAIGVLSPLVQLLAAAAVAP